MISETQYRTLMKEYSKNGGVISHAAMKAQMTHQTAARYLKTQAEPSEARVRFTLLGLTLALIFGLSSSPSAFPALGIGRPGERTFSA